MSEGIAQSIELYRGSELEFDGLVSIDRVIRASLERMLNRSLTGAVIRLVLLGLPDESSPPGEPKLQNLLPDYGYAYVIVVIGGEVIYKHPHPVADLFAFELRRILHERRPLEDTWAFRIGIQRREVGVAIRPTPQVDGAVEITPSERPGTLNFGIRRLAEEPPPPMSLSEFSIEPGNADRAAPIKVLLPAALAYDIATRPLSSDVEEGGFLVGRVYQENGAGDSFIVHLTGAENADYTGASFLHFTFTGDSFGAVKRTLREQRPGERLLGWYHTHLFAASDGMGLSSIDVTLHLTTFTLPWQIAGLLNLDRGHRTLRFYARQDEEMVRCPHWVLP